MEKDSKVVSPMDIGNLLRYRSHEKCISGQNVSVCEHSRSATNGLQYNRSLSPSQVLHWFPLKHADREHIPSDQGKHFVIHHITAHVIWFPYSCLGNGTARYPSWHVISTQYISWHYLITVCLCTKRQNQKWALYHYWAAQNKLYDIVLSENCSEKLCTCTKNKIDI